MNLVSYNGQLVTSNGNLIAPDISQMLPQGIGVVDLGSLNWNSYQSSAGLYYYSNTISDMASGNIEGMCSKYSLITTSSARANKTFWLYDAQKIEIMDSDYSTTQAFKQGNVGVLLFYKKAT